MASRLLPLVLITNTVSPEACAPLKGKARLIMGPASGDLMSRTEVLRLAPKLVGIINQAELQIDNELLGKAPKLKIVANVASGVDNLDLELMANRGVYATNTPEAFAESTADFTLGMMLALIRRLPEADRHVRSGNWRGFRPGQWDGRLLKGKTLGIIGYGSIGKAVAIRARAFGMHVLHTRRGSYKHSKQRSLLRLLKISDVITIHVPLNSETRLLIDKSKIEIMKHGAYLINTSRGHVVDEKALLQALRSGQLAGVALDVFQDEPKVPRDFCQMDNVILTPHIGGGTHESRHNARYLCALNVARVLDGKPPLNACNNPDLNRC